MPEFQRRDLTLNDGTQVWLNKSTGIVDSVKDWSDTYVSSSGGGGNVSGGSGYVSAPTIRSSSVHRQVFFLKFEDGTQREFQTTLVSVAVGHRVTGVYGAKQGKDNGHYLGYYDHTTSTYAFYGLKDYNCEDFGRRRLWASWGPTILCPLFIFLGAIVYNLGFGTIPDFWAAVWPILLVGSPLYAYNKRRAFKNFYNDLTFKALALMREQ